MFYRDLARPSVKALGRTAGAVFELVEGTVSILTDKAKPYYLRTWRRLRKKWKLSPRSIVVRLIHKLAILLFKGTPT